VSDESLDEEAARLFEACRAERPSDSVRERVLALEPRAARQRSRWVGAALVLAAAGALLALGLRARRTAGPSIGAERLVASPARVVEATATPKPSLSNEPNPTASSTPTSRKPVPKPQAAPTTPLTLEEETQALERARASLAAGEPGAALATLDAYQKARGGTLALEATLLRIQALSAAGRTSEASELAQRFVAANPNSPLVDRARRYLTPRASGASRPSEATGSQETTKSNETTGSNERNEP
jgi:hypothetical protein